MFCFESQIHRNESVTDNRYVCRITISAVRYRKRRKFKSNFLPYSSQKWL